MRIWREPEAVQTSGPVTWVVYTGGPASGEPRECTRPEVPSVLWCSVDGHKVTGGPKTSGPHKVASTARPVERPSHEWSTQRGHF